MTREQKEVFREICNTAKRKCDCAYGKCADCDEASTALAILDAELATPGEREWRIMYRVRENSEEWQVPGVFKYEKHKRLAFESLGSPLHKRIESRTPAGPWERVLPDIGTVPEKGGEVIKEANSGEKLTTVDENLKP